MKVKSLADHPALKRIVTLKNRVTEAQENFENAIVDARDAGYSLREIEAVSGISNVTVYNISKRAEKRKKIKV